jgi:anti-sigma factor RsiW
MTCSEFLELLDEVLDNKLDAAVRADMEKHLYRCTNCEVVLNATKKTIEIYRCNEVYEMPDELRTKLHDRIMEKCKSTKIGETTEAAE